MKIKGNRVLTIFVVLVACIVYASISVFTKEASKHIFLSVGYIAWIVGEIVVFGIYAILWQKILSLLSLSTAYTTKSFSIILILLICSRLYDEPITFYKLIGICLIIVGLTIYPWDKEVG